MSKKTEEPRVFEPFVEVEGRGERAVKYPRIEDDIRFLTGKILTIIDASIEKENQNSAMKSLVKHEFSEFLINYQNYCYQGREGHSVNL